MEWISVKDRLPENRQTVLCYSINPHLSIFEEHEGRNVFYDGFTHCYCAVGEIMGVTHWMPLPKPPGEPCQKD